MSKVWLVTGSVSVLGRSIAEAVRVSGDRLMATTRDPRRREDLVAKYGDQVRTAPLDVDDEDAAYRAAQATVDALERLDVCVSNAGCGDIAPFEQLSSEREAVVDTNFCWRRQCDPRPPADHAKAKESLDPSDMVGGGSPGPSRQRRLPCRQVG